MNITKQQIASIFRSLDIPYFTSGKNVSEDSVNIKCPFCDETGDPDPSDHLGVFKGNGVFSCWRCRKKGPFHILIRKLTGFSEERCKEIVESSTDKSDKEAIDVIMEIINSNSETKRTEKSCFDGLPEFFTKVTHDMNYPLLASYLKRRRIPVETVIKHGCGVCKVGKFMNRMIIPVIFNGEIVSFQAADLTGKADLKYKTATSNINDYLYGYDEIHSNGRIIVTEGVLDAWRVDEDVVCTFGTHLTDKQRNLIIKRHPKELIFAYDGDYYWREFGYGSIPGWFTPFVSTIRVVEFPKEHDPDSYGREYGHDVLMKLINSGEV
jgi:hypothetical protein